MIGLEYHYLAVLNDNQHHRVAPNTLRLLREEHTTCKVVLNNKIEPLIKPLDPPTNDQLTEELGEIYHEERISEKQVK